MFIYVEHINGVYCTSIVSWITHTSYDMIQDSAMGKADPSLLPRR